MAPLNHVIGVRIPASQPDFARLRRASSRQARGASAPTICLPRARVLQAKSVSTLLAERAKSDVQQRFEPPTSLAFSYVEAGKSLLGFAELRPGRQEGRQPQPSASPSEGRTGEGCLDAARGASEVGRPTTIRTLPDSQPSNSASASSRRRHGSDSRVSRRPKPYNARGNPLTLPATERFSAKTAEDQERRPSCREAP